MVLSYDFGFGFDNFFPYQFLILQNLVKTENCNYLFWAGDVSDKRPDRSEMYPRLFDIFSTY
ncbi:hypothetical protein BpHYR1_017924 [Brachionus plicatilis]|uniref:Uncharacterized protein n=1 Tax=Brachionus plicatilis TaxID=10195 RepID=A0A3M7SXA0_BRAPC|nr:hypothetical protein BpHYR1_017924 [Brachionus plicatilis]